jgi:hypothetical protein
MNQPGESQIQETIAPVDPAVIKKKVILEPYTAHKGFLFYNRLKRATACFLVEYIDNAIDDLYQHLDEHHKAHNWTHEKVASLYWAGDYNERINKLRDDDEDHYERFIWEYGAYDSALLLPVSRRNKAIGYEILDAIMRDCWECRHKTLSSEKRKKIKEMTPEVKEFHENTDYDPHGWF